MTLSRPLLDIAERYPDCITRSFREQKCSLDTGEIPSNSILCIHGTKYQKRDRNFGKLADRIIFSDFQGGFVCSLELKGGKIGNVRAVVEQIQSGLRLAERELQNTPIVDWFPVLLYGRRVHPLDFTELRAKKNRVYFRNEPKIVQFERCGFRLSEILSDLGGQRQ